MTAGLQGAAASRRARLGAALVVVAAAVLLARSRPLFTAYLSKLRTGHPPAVLAAAAVSALAVGALVAVGLRRRPRVVAGALAAAAAATLVASGNLGAAAAASLLLAATLCVGDLVARVLRGENPGAGDLSATFGAGLVTIGLVVLVLAEAGALSAGAVAVVLLAGVAARPSRLPALARLVTRSLRVPRGVAPPTLEAAWLSFAVLVLAALWMGALCPDVSWDGLAYHLPEARAAALTGRVLPEADLAPQSFLWRTHEDFLSLAFFFGGERVARFLQFGVGLFGFGATLALARRVGRGGAGPLAAFLLAAFPTAMLQLRATYVDWPAAFLVAAAAAELVRAREDVSTRRPALGSLGPPDDAAFSRLGRRLRLAAFLFAGAVTVKIFALLAAPALAVLAWRARPRGRDLAAAAAAAAFVLLPWLAWSARHGGSIAAPYASSVPDLVARAGRGDYFTRSPASGEAAAAPGWGARAARLARLPYDLVFRSSRFEGNGDGYNGVVVLAAAAGLAGWSARRLALFAAVTLPPLLVWSPLYFPSIRFLFPLFPLYAVFVAEGLERLTGGFGGTAGRMAGGALLAAAAAFPVQAGSSGLEARVAVGLASRESYLDERLPAWRLWPLVSPADRLVFVGENDRFHCPAASAWRDDFAPVAAWGSSPGDWSRGLQTLGITALVVREDRRPGAAGLRETLGGRVRMVARSGPAVLWRVGSGNAGAGTVE